MLVNQELIELFLYVCLVYEILVLIVGIFDCTEHHVYLPIYELMHIEFFV